MCDNEQTALLGLFMLRVNAFGLVCQYIFAMTQLSDSLHGLKGHSP
jgi:hypothetical protein